MRKLIFLIFTFIFFNGSFVFAEWEKPKARLSNGYRFFIREQDSFYIQRGEINFSYNRKTVIFLKIKLSPFIEVTNNLDREKMEHKGAGLEIGADVFDWLYLGESFQYARYNYDWANWIWHPYIKHAAEAETHIMFSLPIYDFDDGRKIKIYALNEFTYSLKLAEGTRNEGVLGLTIPVAKYIDIGFDWRHIDRIHDFDSDALEASLTLCF